MAEKIWRPVEDGKVPDSNLFIEAAEPNGWLLRFGKNGASVWFPDAVRLCVRVDVADVAEPELDWDKAKAHLDFYERTYRELGPVGAFGLGLTIVPLQDRYARGERTKWLYDDIMEVE